MSLETASGVELGRAAIALILVLGLVVTIGWAAKRWRLPFATGPSRHNARIRIAEARMIDAKTRVVLIAIDGNEVPLAIGPGYCTVLHATMTATNGTNPASERLMS